MDRFRRRQPDFTNRNPNGGMNFSSDINPGGIRERLTAVRFPGFMACDHKSIVGCPLTVHRNQLDNPLSFDPDDFEEKMRSALALRQESLRQHYLEQVQRVCCAPAQTLSAFATGTRR
jgi:hypothetical protein